ncbi:mannan endo-1,4-beta-mannosidase 4 [Ricinus communis]|uniref:mannan endo-1,4-beta-mannosidase n=1 Tax=Ricinus communis TaxID=3988 RepID=B9RN03_RICCO|nr:mannan endo-1,4-beta-mannosidase 4 [Ricinus communis]EEF47126.1 hydrolase, hydrolyzing O-glycosyl compounds, putative [Ricinus communis]|eukprot:XP_002515142.1 mannan endo-1,4-beta-mannosidase 4 [Ricinus communis]
MRRLNNLRLVAILLIFRLHVKCMAQSQTGSNNNGIFAKTNGTHFVMNNKSLYLNGFNAYWMMYMASDPSTREKVTSAFQQAAKNGMNIARTWAFSDGGYRALQISPGSYNQDMFKGLDFVISEARKYGIYVILCLVNNYKDFGGRPQYVQWARERGQQLTADDDFYTNPIVKAYYKNHVKAVITRINTITRVAYKDDPTIFAWELMNEPRSDDSPAGAQIQEWIKEMAAHVKSIDSNHLLEIGLEGFYGKSRKQFNPGNYLFGTDFISNNRIPDIDFATIHLYPEQWLPNSSEEEQAAFVNKWVQAHIEDSNLVIGKPLIIGEFGKSSKIPGYSLEKRDSYFVKIYDAIYSSAITRGPYAGGLFWQLMAQGMDSWGDGYEVVLEDCSSTASIIAQQSGKLSSII